MNIPYLDEEGSVLEDFSFKNPDNNIVDAMEDLTRFLKAEITPT